MPAALRLGGCLSGWPCVSVLGVWFIVACFSWALTACYRVRPVRKKRNLASHITVRVACPAPPISMLGLAKGGGLAVRKKRNLFA